MVEVSAWRGGRQVMRKKVWIITWCKIGERNYYCINEHSPRWLLNTSCSALKLELKTQLTTLCPFWVMGCDCFQSVYVCATQSTHPSVPVEHISLWSALMFNYTKQDKTMSSIWTPPALSSPFLCTANRKHLGISWEGMKCLILQDLLS